MDRKIKIVKNGPYIVSGNIPLIEEKITLVDNEYKIVKTKDFEVGATYALCRCGQSANMPFCDGAHEKCKFSATQKSIDDKFFDYAKIYDGHNITLYDMEKLCSFARVCHSNMGDIWDLAIDDDDEENLKKAIELAWACPSGRLIVYDKKLKKIIEPKLNPTLSILQDSTRKCSGPICVKGNIEIVNDDDRVFEKRNRVNLCRCGKTSNSPFCDATHYPIDFKNGYDMD